MSAFLGPIHYWLYNKIQKQEYFINKIASLTDIQSLKEESHKLFGQPFDGNPSSTPLEDMIEHDNIHGWLQEQISRLEYSFAYIVTSILNAGHHKIDDLKSLMYQIGIEDGNNINMNEMDALKIYKFINDTLLDGMPCDHVNKILEQSSSTVVWTRSLCVHQNYWDKVNGDIHIYYALRESWIEGLLSNSKYAYKQIDPTTYSIEYN